MSWNLEEFRTLCTNLGVPDTKIYQDALFLKSWRTSFFGGKALAAWENLHSTSTEIVVGGEEWNKIQFEAESFIEAALQASHSLADIIAQLINVTVLRNHFAEEDVSLNRVLQELVNRGTATQLTQTIQQFINSSTYQYVNGFVNTIKHRNLIYTDFHVEFGVGTRNEQGMRFKAFTYKNVHFPVMWASDIVNEIIPQMDSGIISIGNAINDYLE